MKVSLLVALVALVLALPLTRSGAAADPPPTREEVEAMMGLRSEGDLVRGQLDTIGFVVTEAQAEEVVAAARRLEADALAEQDAKLGMAPDEGFVAGICPHDDHLYSARVTVHLTERISAPTVVMVGVFHKARLWNLAGRLVFDRFEAWHAPWGPVQVDPLRDELVAALPEDAYVVSNAMHCREHSIESIVPFLQDRNRGVRIVPILVPYVDWDELSRLSDLLADALAGAVERHGWALGRDLAIVISSDAVHYGEDFEHAPFGVDAPAYERAIERDLGLIHRFLARRLEADAARELLATLVDPDDVRRYRIPWCGRFSIPFGTELVRKLSDRLGVQTPSGALLRYGTTLSEPELPVSAATRDAGLGYTAPSNLHHWVGFFSLGYRLLPAG